MTAQIALYLTAMAISDRIRWPIVCDVAMRARTREGDRVWPFSGGITGSLCRREPADHVNWSGDVMTLHIRAQPLYTKKWTMAMAAVDVMIRVHRADIVAPRRLMTRIDRPDGTVTVIDVATPMR